MLAVVFPTARYGLVTSMENEQSGIYTSVSLVYKGIHGLLSFLHLLLPSLLRTPYGIRTSYNCHN